MTTDDESPDPPPTQVERSVPVTDEHATLTEFACSPAASLSGDIGTARGIARSVFADEHGRDGFHADAVTVEAIAYTIDSTGTVRLSFRATLDDEVANGE